jgi:hypothetical protein
MKYRIQIIKDDSDVIAERDVTPDMVIALLTEMVTNNSGEAIQDEAPLPPCTHKSNVDRPEKGNSPVKADRKKSACGKCGKTGHNAKTCLNQGGGTITETTREGAKSAMTPDQYDALRTAMHGRRFSSAEYALSKKIPPREVYAAIRSADYDDYLETRV